MEDHMKDEFQETAAKLLGDGLGCMRRCLVLGRT